MCVCVRVCVCFDDFLFAFTVTTAHQNASGIDLKKDISAPASAKYTADENRTTPFFVPTFFVCSNFCCSCLDKHKYRGVCESAGAHKYIHSSSFRSVSFTGFNFALQIVCLSVCLCVL